MLGAVPAFRFPSIRHLAVGPALLPLVGLVLGAALPGGACVQDPGAGLVSALDVCALSTDGSLCDDRQPCTIDDACINHVCVGTPVADGRSCTDGNVCTGPDQCLAGVCVGAMLADGTACTDDDACTDPDLCQLGGCVAGGARACDDGDPCTLDTCVSPGGCVFSPRECVMPADAGVDLGVDLSTEASFDTPPDLRPDLAIDVEPPDGPDAISEGGLPDDAEPDIGALDTGGDVAAVPDAGRDAAPEVGVDTPTAGADAAPDAGGDDLTPTAPDLRARGGGCQCALAGGPGAGAPGRAWSLTSWLGAALALALAWRPGRRRRARARKKI
jgi:hypothetical protein